MQAFQFTARKKIPIPEEKFWVMQRSPRVNFRRGGVGSFFQIEVRLCEKPLKSLL
jgi:hypothetical protein